MKGLIINKMNYILMTDTELGFIVMVTILISVGFMGFMLYIIQDRKKRIEYKESLSPTELKKYQNFLDEK